MTGLLVLIPILILILIVLPRRAAAAALVTGNWLLITIRSRLGVRPYVTSSQNRVAPFRVCRRETRCVRSWLGRLYSESSISHNVTKTQEKALLFLVVP